MTLTTARTDRRPGTPGPGARTTGPASAAGAGGTPSTGAAPGPRRPRGREADGLAVASFVLGLLGLLVMNILLGPAAVVMALIALARSTARRGRALLGLALGVADLVVLAVLVTANGTVSWSFGG
ncbi:hypothetical protein [Streptomyces griseus]|uniref:hypothetical protein n=1 Tax=Streptomyces griseus TaxID=1911 RepID=UPI0008407D7A|nr:hypothetical protein [Streptomyces griseus]